MEYFKAGVTAKSWQREVYLDGRHQRLCVEAMQHDRPGKSWAEVFATDANGDLIRINDKPVTLTLYGNVEIRPVN